MRKLVYWLLGWYLEQFRPDLIVDTVADLDLEMLRRDYGIRVLLLDCDNTLCGRGATTVSDEIVRAIVRPGFRRYIVSNVIHRSRKRLKRLATITAAISAEGFLDLGFLTQKPRPWGIREAARRMGSVLLLSSTAMVGDGLTTDVRATQRAAVVEGPFKYQPLAIWVRQPILPESWHIRFIRRPFERFIAWTLEL